MMARMMAECIPSTTSWVGVMLIGEGGVLQQLTKRLLGAAQAVAFYAGVSGRGEGGCVGTARICTARASISITNGTYTRRSSTLSTCRKSQARMPEA